MNKYQGNGFDVFRSKKFWSAVVGLVVLVVTAFVPELTEHLDTIAPAVVAIVGVLIGGYAWQDVKAPLPETGHHGNMPVPDEPSEQS